MNFGEICFWEDWNLEDISLANKPKQSPKNVLVILQKGLTKLPPIDKVMENQNFKCNIPEH